jgi:hypothetical protein
MMKKVILAMVLMSMLFIVGCSAPYNPPVPFFWGPFSFIWWLLGAAIYFLPIIVAVVRKKQKLLGIVLLNIFLGWSFIGWIIALIWAFSADR